MRTPLLATLFGLSLVACAGQIDGGGGGGDDVAPNCGNGVMDEGETCDDGNTASNDGCSATCLVEAVPRVAITVDKPSITTDLEVENTFTVTATSEMGFSGGVVLSAAVVDATDTPITGWTATLEGTTLDLSTATTATTQLKVTIPGDHAALAGTIRISGSSSVALAQSNIAVTANPVVAVTFTESGGNCVYPNRFVNNPYRIKAGRQIMVYNGAAAGTMTIHVGGGVTGFSHENTGTAQPPGQAYAGTPSGTPGSQTEFYCHAGGAGTIGDNSTATTQPNVRVE